MNLTSRMNLEGRWPELFEGLSPHEYRAVVQSLVANWHEGWVPNREDLKNLVEVVTGAMDENEYMRRSAVLARARANVGGR